MGINIGKVLGKCIKNKKETPLELTHWSSFFVRKYYQACDSSFILANII